MISHRFWSLFILGTALFGQQQPGLDAQKAAMKKLSFLVGKWSGDASVVTGPGQTLKIRQNEDVQSKLDGLVLLIEGTGRDSESGKVVFNALATVAFDEASGKYRFRAYSRGHYLDTELIVTPDGFEWGHQMGPVTVRNVMKLGEKGEWIEYTEAKAGPGPPRRTVELTVHRDSSGK